MTLVVAKNGPKLEPPKEGPNDFSRIPAPGHRFFNQNQLSMAVFADLLSRQVDRPVLDMTGLKGYFAVKVEWATDDARETENPGPSLFTALQEQLGLKLEARKGPLEILVIDHAEKVPTEN